MTRLAGPWAHRDVAANGARFHIAEAGAGPLVLFLHGFPEFWWAWRDQLPAVAGAGYRAAAMDLRGYGGSDKTPRGYDPLTLSADVAGVVRTLGARSAILVGQGWGGYVAWAVAAAHPDCVSALCAVAAPHPTELLRSPLRLLIRAPVAHVAAMQLPWIPERRIHRGDYVTRHLSAWAAPGSPFPAPEVAERYRVALADWPSPHCALEYHRWLFRSRLRADGRAFAKVMKRPIDVPVLQVVGAYDPAVRTAAVTDSARHVTGSHEVVTIETSGHFPHEEAPDSFNDALLGWLSRGAVSGVDPGV
ncbi:MAG: alpha/beta hydrolase [Nocardioidaceae bacterium]